MAQVIDTGVLSQLNDFPEVDWQSIQRARHVSQQLPENAFNAMIVFL
jgi:hypothetical protein